MTKLITIKQILALNPCYIYGTEEKIIAATDNNWPKTMREISELDIPAEDRFWVLNGLLDPTTSGHVACDIAESVLHLYEAQYPVDYRVRDCIAAKRMWLDGLVDDETLITVRAAARTAACYAATSGDTYDVAYYAAYAACAAASDASAAPDACHAAYYTTYYTTRAGTWDKNLEILKKYL